MLNLAMDVALEIPPGCGIQQSELGNLNPDPREGVLETGATAFTAVGVALLPFSFRGEGI